LVGAVFTAGALWRNGVAGGGVGAGGTGGVGCGGTTDSSIINWIGSLGLGGDANHSGCDAVNHRAAKHSAVTDKEAP
jgi:hypothetical protein